MAEPTHVLPESVRAGQHELSNVEQEAALQMRRAQRTIWLAGLLGLAMALVLIAWAILGPSLSHRAQLIFGLLVAAEATTMGFALAVYARHTYLRAVEHYVGRLRELAQRLQEASVRDSLTGLYNHGYLLSRLQEEIARAQRHQRALCLAIIDLNEFKEVNDHHGHLVGDEVLQLIGSTIRQQVRQHDIVARYGGDEFCLVLPETDRAGAERAIEKLRSAVAALPERVEGWAGHPITFGCGIATCPEDGVTALALISAADASLYRGKRVQRLERAREEGALVQNVFYRIGDTLSASLYPEERLNRLVEAVCTSLNLRSASLLWYKDGGLQTAARYFADLELEAAILRVQAAKPLKPEESPGFRAVQHNDVVTLEQMTAEHGVPERLAAVMPAGLWGQWSPLSIPEHPPAVLFLTGMAGEAAPPEPGLTRALARLLAGAIQNSLDFEDARRQRDQLAALADVGSALLEPGSVSNRLKTVATRIGSVVGYLSVTVIAYDPRGRSPYLRSMYSRAPAEVLAQWDEVGPMIENPGVREFFASATEPVVIRDLPNDRTVTPAQREILKAAGARSGLVAPLRFQGELLGLIAVSSTNAEGFRREDVTLLSAIANQIAPVLKTALLHRELEQSYQDLRQAHMEAMLRLAAVAEARDPFTGNHLHRLRAYTEAIARRLGLSDGEAASLGHAGVVHDIGKLRIPDGLLAKQGPLTEEEWALIRKHPAFGEELLGENAFYEEARQVARWHHERWDGTGYPDGLSGEALPLSVRIISVADVFDALTSPRPYKDAWPIEQAVVYIREQRGKHFAPEVVDAFLELARDGSLEAITGALPEIRLEQPGPDERLVA